MNKVILLACFLAAAATTVVAQNRPDSTGAVRKERVQGESKHIDRDGNGIDDRTEIRGRGMQRGKDRFVDLNNDGICDGRESGLGLRRGTGAMSGTLSGGKGGTRHRGGRP